MVTRNIPEIAESCQAEARRCCASRSRETRYARGVRHVLLLLLFAGCFGSLDANGRPAVMPKLSELPGDPVKRDAVLDQANPANQPEKGKALTKKERKVETVAAFAAALIGEAFSKTSNVTFGTSTTIDENHLFEHAQKQRAGEAQGNGSGSASPPDATPDPGQLTPWIKLK